MTFSGAITFPFALHLSPANGGPCHTQSQYRHHRCMSPILTQIKTSSSHPMARAQRRHSSRATGRRWSRTRRPSPLTSRSRSRSTTRRPSRPTTTPPRRRSPPPRTRAAPARTPPIRASSHSPSRRRRRTGSSRWCTPGTR